VVMVVGVVVVMVFVVVMVIVHLKDKHADAVDNQPKNCNEYA